MGILFTIVCVLGFGSLIITLLIVGFWEIKIKKEKKLFDKFLAETQGVSQPVKASVEYDDDTFVGGTVFCNDDRSFTFEQESAFTWALKRFGLKAEYVW